MANKFKSTSGSNNFSDDTNAWVTSTGGSTTTTHPTSLDDAFLDANSNNCVINAVSTVKSIDCNGYAGTLSGSSGLTVGVGGTGGSTLLMRFVPGMTVTYSGTITLTPNAAPASRQVTFAGKTLVGLTVFAGSTNGTQFVDACSLSGTLTLTGGILNTNSQTVTVSTLSASNSTARTITITNSTVTLTGTGTVWNTATTTNLTLNATGSTIAITDTSATGKTFAGGGLTYASNITITGGSGTITFTGSNTFNGTFTSGTGKLVFTSTTQTLGGTVDLTGCQSITGGAISVASGTVTAPSGCTITNSTASGGATFDATAATLVGTCTGWTGGATFSAGRAVATRGVVGTGTI